MDYDTARALVERYFAGTTTTEEEARLRRYFQGPDVPADLQTYRPMFQYFTEARAETTSAGFAERPSSPPRIARRRRLSRSIWSAAAVAATVVLALAVWWVAPVEEVVSPPQTAAIDWSRYEPRDEAEALRITAAAFRKTSTSLRMGLEAATDELKSVKKIVQPF